MAAAHRTFVGSIVDRSTIADDDIARHRGDATYFDGIEIREMRFAENGFNWHFIRFASMSDADGPLFVVPHDDENAAFEAMIAAVKQHGGVGVAVNSGPGAVRLQTGRGVCGARSEIVTSCDPNRNFSEQSAIFTRAFLDQRAANQPVVALHTNNRGFNSDGQGGSGSITMLDAAAFRKGVITPIRGGHFAVDPQPDMANYDTFGLTPYLASKGLPDEAAIACQKAITRSGVHFWHERVERSDGSMSNYLALYRPDIRYFNAESRSEPDLALAAARHKMMIDTYLSGCAKSGDKPGS